MKFGNPLIIQGQFCTVAIDRKRLKHMGACMFVISANVKECPAESGRFLNITATARQEVAPRCL